jgi:hypothetical protein
MDVTGVSHLRVTCQIDGVDMTTWSAERITAFFEGLAQAIRAAEGAKNPRIEMRKDDPAPGRPAAGAGR